MCSIHNLEQELSTVCPDELFRQVSDFLKVHGFGSCIYELETPVPIFCPKVIAFSYGFQDDLLPDQLAATLEHDSSLIFAPVAGNAVCSPADFTANEGQRWEHQETTRDKFGVIGRLTLARQHIEPSARVFAYAITSWILRIIHERMVRILLPKLIPEARITMTCREREILRWTAEGKTASEIAQILSLSDRTVNFHIKNIMRKFDSTNKITVAVKAMALGMLN